MTLIYKLEDDTVCTLEELAEKYKEEWAETIIDIYKFWAKHSLCLEDLIAEASDEFEDVLCEQEVYIELLEDTDYPSDLNVLLNDIRIWGE